MTALEALVQHTQKHDQDLDHDDSHDHGLTLVRTNTNLEPLRPPRVNLAGYCVMCLEHGCTSARCEGGYQASVWEICRYCDGSGYNANTGHFCDCESGLVDLTHSVWINRPAPRPPRLNFAGWCLWCDDRWCDNPACIARHPRSIWAVCHHCDGRGCDEYTVDPCGFCSYGLIESRCS